MTKEEIKEVFFEERHRIRKMIDENREGISLSDIDTEIWGLYKPGGRLSHIPNDFVYGVLSMKADIYTHYLVMCNVFGLIPKSGYLDLEEDKHETAEETR